MDDIDKARTIRELVLGSNDVEWGSTVFEDAEHSCWHVRGVGWRATISNLWDVMNGRQPTLDQADRFALTRHSIVEVFDAVSDEPILGMSYGDHPEEDLVFRFAGEICARLFKIELSLTQLTGKVRSPTSAVFHGPI